MTLNELDARIAAKEGRLARLRQEASQLQLDIAAAKAFREAFPRIMAPDESSATTSAVPLEIAPLIPSHESLTTAGKIRHAMERCGDDFTLYDIEERLMESGFQGISRNMISIVLSDWARRKKIFVRERGGGRSPSIYTKTAPAPPLAMAS